MIVTGFFDLTVLDAWRERPAQEYHARADWLLDAPVPLALFAYGLWRTHQRHGFALLQYDPDFTTIGDRDAAAQTLQSGKQTIAWNKGKDTAAYLCLMRHKIEWLARAAREQLSDCYWWVDYGYRNLPEDHPADLLTLKPAPGMIRIAELSHVPRVVRHQRELFYASHWWPVGGGVFAAREPETSGCATRSITSGGGRSKMAMP